MAVYSVRGFTAATAATADHCVANLWNPDAAQRVKVHEIGIYISVANTANMRWHISRTTTLGTPGSTVTPDADNSWTGHDVPPSGVTWRLAAFTVQPVLATPPLNIAVHRGAAGNAGSGFVWVFGLAPLELKPGSGVGIFTGSAVLCPASEVYVVFEEN